MNRRVALTLLGMGTSLGRGQVRPRELELKLNRGSAAVTDEAGRVAYRFPQFNASVEVDIGEGQTIQLCCVPGGTGLMGSERQWGALSALRSTPVHEVWIPGFLLGRFEVTQAQWLRVSRLPRINRDLQVPFQPFRTPEEQLAPVEIMAWLSAQEFCDRLARLTGIPFRLPSESEWEYACRAGTRTWFHFGETIGPDWRNSEVFSGQRFQPVGNKNAPNRFGLHDMHGGVGEWCADWSHPNYVGAPADGSPWVSGGNSEFRIIRGVYDLIGQGSAGRIDFPRGGSATGFSMRVAATYAHGILDPQAEAAVHGLSGAPDVVSPGQIVSIRGNLIGPVEAVSTNAGEDGRIPDSLAGVQVFVGDVAVPVLSAARNRVDFLMPMGIPAGSLANLVLRYGWQSAAPLRVKVLPAAPELFARDAADGQLLALNENGSVNGPGSPAARDTWITLYGSGFGELSPFKEDGTIVTGEVAQLPRPLLPLTIRIGGEPAVVQYCGQAPGMVLGIVQVNVRIPLGVRSGEAAVEVTMGEQRNQAVAKIQVA